MRAPTGGSSKPKYTQQLPIGTSGSISVGPAKIKQNTSGVGKGRAYQPTVGPQKPAIDIPGMVEYYRQNPMEAAKAYVDMIKSGSAPGFDLGDSIAKGDKVGAGMALAGMIPVLPEAKAVGALAKVARAARGAKVAEEAASAAGKAGRAAKPLASSVADAIGPEAEAAARRAVGQRVPAKPAVTAPKPLAEKPSLQPPLRSGYASSSSHSRAVNSWLKKVQRWNTENPKDQIKLPSGDDWQVGKTATSVRQDVQKAEGALTADEKQAIINGRARTPRTPEEQRAAARGEKVTGTGTKARRVDSRDASVGSDKTLAEEIRALPKPKSPVRGKTRQVLQPTGEYGTKTQLFALKRIVPKGMDADKWAGMSDAGKLRFLKAKKNAEYRATVESYQRDLATEMKRGRVRSDRGQAASPDLPPSQAPMVKAPKYQTGPTAKQTAQEQAGIERAKAAGVTEDEYKAAAADPLFDAQGNPREGILSPRRGKINDAEKARQKEAEGLLGAAMRKRKTTAKLMRNRLEGSRGPDQVAMDPQDAARLRPKSGTRVGDKKLGVRKRGVASEPAGPSRGVPRGAKAPATGKLGKQRGLDALEARLRRTEDTSRAFDQGIDGGPVQSRPAAGPLGSSSFDFHDPAGIFNREQARASIAKGNSDSTTRRYLAWLERNGEGDGTPRAAIVEERAKADAAIAEGKAKKAAGTPKAPSASKPGSAYSKGGIGARFKDVPEGKAFGPKKPTARQRGQAATSKPAPKPAVGATPEAAPRGPAKPGAKFDNGGVEAKYIGVPKDKAFGPEAPPKGAAPKAKAPSAKKPSTKKPKASAEETVSEDRAAGRAAGAGKPIKPPKPSKPAKAPKGAAAEGATAPATRKPRTPNASPVKEAQIRKRAASIRRESSSQVALDARQMGHIGRKGKAAAALAGAGVVGYVARNATKNQTIAAQSAKPAPKAPAAQASAQSTPTLDRKPLKGKDGKLYLLDRQGRKISVGEYQRRQAYRAAMAKLDPRDPRYSKMRQDELNRRARYEKGLGSRTYGQSATKVTRNADVPPGIALADWRAMTPAERRLYKR